MSSRYQCNVRMIYELWCEVKCVSRSSDDSKLPTGIIVESFPESYKETRTIAEIPAFAFPCEFNKESIQFYSFVLTNDDSKWRFGYCRYDPKTDSSLVIISYLPWHDIFESLLKVVADLRQNYPTEIRDFLHQLYTKAVPDPGGSLNIYYNSGKSCFVFTRPQQFQLPSIPQNKNLSLYYNFAHPKNMIAVFAAMLAERRIIFTSNHLDRLSSCIQAANAFLYPMVWQHIFVPILPMKLKDYLCAPMPYLVGVAGSILEMTTPEELGDVVIFNCDRNTIESPFDDVNELPAEIVSQLKKELNQTHQLNGDRVSKIFLEVLVQLIGGYRDAVEFMDVGKVFNPKKFIDTRPSSLRPFLTKMMQFQIFQQFIDERLQMLNTGLGFSDEFEIETVRYAEKMKKRRRGNIFKNVKEKTNPAMRSAVKSVKEGSKGFKTYISTKAKFHDSTPLPTTSNSKQSNSYFIKHIQMSNSHATRNNAGHHSAPSSPLCNKRNVNELVEQDSPDMANRSIPGRHSDYLSVSTYTSNGSEHESCGPSSSNTPQSSVSSIMNLTQELEDHPLFKPPIVDRTLKKSNTLGTQQQMNLLRTTSTNTTCTAAAAAAAASISLARQKPVMGSGVKKYRQITMPKMTYSSGNSPPRRGDYKKDLDKGINNLERNCWKNYATSDEQTSSSNTSVSSTSASLLSSSSITSDDSNVSFVSASSNNNQHQPEQQQQQVQQPPVPLPRLRKEKYREMNCNKNNLIKPKELEEEDESDVGIMQNKDLIYLDDFDWKDFDPLNINARPLPMMTRDMKISTLPQKLQTQHHHTTNDNNVTRQIAKLNEAPPLPKSLPPSMPRKKSNDDDFELLRKYGLDQFTLPESSSTATNSPCHQIVSKQLRASRVSARSNWTTFE